MKVKYSRIAEILKEKERSSYWLAGVLGVSRATAWGWANHKREPSVPQLYEIAAALDVPAKTLLEDDERIYEQMKDRIDQIRGESKVYPRQRGRNKK